MSPEHAHLTGPEVQPQICDGVNLDTVRAIEEVGADLICVGALTHSARFLDISLRIDGVS